MSHVNRSEYFDYAPDPREQMGPIRGFFYWLFVEGPQERRFWRDESKRRGALRKHEERPLPPPREMR